MTTVTRTCAKCGANIFAEAPQEFCSACFLRVGLHLLTDEPVAGVGLSAVAPKAFGAAKTGSAEAEDPGSDNGAPVRNRKKAARPGEMLGEFGDYQLQEEIGRGGQGLVYRARQKSLNRTVALKVIGLGQWASEAHLKRFRREAEAAASLDHPGIVPIYEVGEREGSCYFSMKFVEGGQLDEVVRRAPMSIRQAAELVAKVARTVHYAHEHGILHRDIKPGNILLDANGGPHLTDFGLARLVETESTVTATLDVLGTPSYMAPEQAAGGATNASKATDVYGLGAVLYQLLTGQPPFAGGTTYETIKLVLDGDLRPPRSLNSKIDRELSTVCLKCLEKDPKRRYSSALALAEDLEHWLKHEPIQAKPSGFFTHSLKWVRRNPGMAVMAALLVALATVLSMTVWNRKPVALIPKSVAVLPFENLSDDPNNGYFADGIQEEILTRLASIADLKVISRTSTQRYHSKPRNLSEIAKQLGVANIVEGSVQKAADQVRVNVQLINAQTDSHLWADTYDRKLTNVLGVESEIAKRIAESLQAKLSGSEQQALTVKPTNNPEAYDAYLRGLAFQARGYTTSVHPDLLGEAIGFFERAVQLDPNFAIAWARLSRAHGFFYFTGEDMTAARRDAATKALENAQKLDPNSPETLLALGYYQYRLLRDYGLAKTTFKQVSKMLPSSSEVPFALGVVARREGNWDETFAYFEEALIFDPRNTELLDETGWTYQMLRQFPAALKLYDRAVDVRPKDPHLMARKASVYQAEGNLEGAASLLSEINEQTPPNQTFVIKVIQLRLERNYDDAVRLLQTRLAQFHFASQYEKGGYQVMLAMTEGLAGDTSGAKATAEQARKTLEPLCKDQPDNFFSAQQLSLAYAALGEKEAALKEAERAIRLRPRAKDAFWGPAYEESLALIQAMFGENSRAISTLSQLLQTPYNSGIYDADVTPALLRVDPLWDPLRGDPAFRKLCEEKIDKSVAVLPFENLSKDPDNAYFAEGIQEEILTRLAKIADLKVISRTSTQRYQSKPNDFFEIAKQLGVANILEGSVQKAGDQVRVNVQLINAQTDSHLWADTFDRKLTDIFSVESEVARAVADQLRAKLTTGEEQLIGAKPTENIEAYDAYLRGLAYTSKATASPANSLGAQKYLKEAVRLDPGFALAWAQLSYTDSFLYFDYVLQKTAALRDEARQAADTALALQPHLGEALLAKGFFHFACLNDFNAAERYYEEASPFLPNNSQFVLSRARLAWYRHQWKQAEVYFEEAERLDPHNVKLFTAHANLYQWLRRFPEAIRKLDQALNISPDDNDVLIFKASIAQLQGDLPRAATILKTLHLDRMSVRIAFDQALLERQPWQIISTLKGMLAKPDPSMGFYNADLRFCLGWAYEIAGDHYAAQETWRAARRELEYFLKEQPYNVSVIGELALTSTKLGDKSAAFSLLERARSERRITGDALNAPQLVEWVARVAAQSEDPDRAIDALQTVLSTPYSGAEFGPPTPELLRFDPMFDPLRGDPRFEKILEEAQQPLAVK